MAGRERLPEIARSEFEVLKVLWDQGRLSAREVHDRLESAQGWAYSTTRTVLDRMVKKGLVERAGFHGVFLYQAAIGRPLGLARMVRDFAERVLELDSAAVLPLFARSEALTAEEVAELSRLLDGAGGAEDGEDAGRGGGGEGGGQRGRR